LSTTKNANQDLPLATTADDVAANLTKVRSKLAQNVAKGRLSADDVKDIAAKLKAVGDALKSDGVNGVLTRTQVADLANQLRSAEQGDHHFGSGWQGAGNSWRQSVKPARPEQG